MKTLLITSDFPPLKGGVANVNDNIVNHWPEKDKMFVLVDDANAVKNAKDENLNVIRRNMSLKHIWPHWLPALFFLFKEISEKKISHVIVGQLLPFGTITWLVSFVLRIRYSVIIHGMELPLAFRNSRKKFLAKKIINGANQIICPNNYVAEQVRAIINNKEKVTVVYPGVNVDLKCSIAETQKLRDKLGLNGKTLMLSLHRMVRRKGTDMVLEALPQIKELFPDLVYAVVGNGPDKKALQEQAKKYDNVIFADCHTDEEKWRWFCACDFFIMPSRDIDGDFEGFGIVYLEANLIGKAVIAGDSGGVREAVIHEYNGLMVDPNKPDSIANAVIRLCKDPQLRFKLGEQGRARVIKDFDWGGQVRKIYEIIK